MLPASLPRTKSESDYNGRMESRRWLPRFSLRQLLLATALAAVGCYALRWASPWWSIVLFYANLAAVVAAALIAINCPGEPRSFWAGFCVCAVLHWVLAFEPGFDNGIPPHHPGAFATRWLSAYTYQQLKPQLKVDPIRVDPFEIGAIRGRWGGDSLGMTAPGGSATVSIPSFKAGEDGYFRGFGPGPFFIFEEDFVNVALGFWTLLVGYVGGHVLVGAPSLEALVGVRLVPRLPRKKRRLGSGGHGDLLAEAGESAEDQVDRHRLSCSRLYLRPKRHR